jgi:hypothetical protein
MKLSLTCLLIMEIIHRQWTIKTTRVRFLGEQKLFGLETTETAGRGGFLAKGHHEMRMEAHFKISTIRGYETGK